MDKKVDQQKGEGWHRAWEDNVYGKGRHLNLYPYHAVVSFILSRYNRVPFEERIKIKILELGCGAGNNLWFAAREGFSVAGIDGSATAIEYANNRIIKEGLAGDLRIGDFSSLPWPDKTFDLVLDRAALACVNAKTIKIALEESNRVLKAGGHLLSIIYSWEHPGRGFGKLIGENTYSEFSGGRFFGLGTAHFATRKEIDDLYGVDFTLKSVVHTREVEMLGNASLVSAFWKIECVKE